MFMGSLTFLSQPRSNALEGQRTQAFSRNIFSWVSRVSLASEADILHDCGLETMLFLRYLRLLVTIFGPSTIVISPLLIPLTLVGVREPSQGS